MTSDYYHETLSARVQETAELRRELLRVRRKVAEAVEAYQALENAPMGEDAGVMELIKRREAAMEVLAKWLRGEA